MPQKKKKIKFRVVKKLKTTSFEEAPVREKIDRAKRLNDFIRDKTQERKDLRRIEKVPINQRPAISMMRFDKVKFNVKKKL